jgi:hypothetical protein
MKRNQWSAALLAVLLFCCGAAVGALGHRYYTDVVIAKTGQTARQRYISETQAKCKLTPTQVNELDAILDDTRAKVKAVRDSYHPQMVKIHDEQVSRVKSILTPEQVPAYEQLVAERERRSREQDERDRQEELKRAARRQQATH